MELWKYALTIVAGAAIAWVIINSRRRKSIPQLPDDL